MRRLLTVLITGASLAAVDAPAQTQPRARELIIDMHLHASGATDYGRPPVPVCPGGGDLVSPVRQDSFDLADLMQCRSPLLSGATDEEIMRRTLALMERHDVIGVTSGPIARVRRWKAAAPERILVAAGAVHPDSIRRWKRDGTVQALAELTFQYRGIAPGDSLPEQYFSLAAELDLPVGLHMGPGPPGAPYYAAPQYRMRLSDPLLLEEPLLRHRMMRLYVMHAGWPMLDRMLALLWAHPQVYVDVGVISWAIPPAEFHAYLRRMVEAGYGKRIMFGSDQMVWPEALPLAIENVRTAAFLSAEQKRDILCRNAARFLRLAPDPC